MSVLDILFITWWSLSATRINVSTVCKPWICWNITHLYIANLFSFRFNLILSIMLWQCCGCCLVRFLCTQTRREILPKSSQKYCMVSHVQMLKYSLGTAASSLAASSPSDDSTTIPSTTCYECQVINTLWQSKKRRSVKLFWWKLSCFDLCVKHPGLWELICEDLVLFESFQ